MTDKTIDALERLARLLDEGKISRTEYDDLKLGVLKSAPPAGGSEQEARPGDKNEGGETSENTSTPPGRDERYGAIDSLSSKNTLLVIALWVNAGYWALQATFGYDLSFSPVFWGSNGVGDWVLMIEGLYPWVLLANSVVFVVWSYQAHANLRLLGRHGMRHGDHETVWWWVVPVANLFMPYRVIYETVRGTVAPLDDRNWRSHAVPPLVHWWTGAFLAGLIVVVVSRGMVNTSVTVDELTAGAAGYTLGAATLTVAAVLAAKLTTKTTEGQAVQIRRLVGRQAALTTTSTSESERASLTRSRPTSALPSNEEYLDRLARGKYWES